MDMEKNYLTEEGLGNLKKELEYLKTVKRKEIAERLKQAASFGDLKENAAYDEAKESQGFLEGRILQLESLIKNALIVKKEQKDAVQIGNTAVITKDFKNKKPKTEKFTIIGPVEADPLQNKLSSESPLGKTLLNKKVGDIFTVDAPEGKIKYKVLKIE